jgi:hypothetical protein
LTRIRAKTGKGDADGHLGREIWDVGPGSPLEKRLGFAAQEEESEADGENRHSQCTVRAEPTRSVFAARSAPLPPVASSRLGAGSTLLTRPPRAAAPGSSHHQHVEHKLIFSTSLAFLLEYRFVFSVKP